jgi:hypothetical protein
MLMIIHATDLLCAARASPSDAVTRWLAKQREAKSERGGGRTKTLRVKEGARRRAETNES